jgi:glycosyltransferase involved in cell wall biosynthesis
MKIGIDAASLTGKFTGIARATLAGIHSLSETGHDLYLYFPKAPVVDASSFSRAVVRISGFSGAIGRHIWAQTVLPRQAAQDGVDVLWGPAHRLPLVLAAGIARVVTIHDLVCYDMPETMPALKRAADCLLMPPAVHSADRVIAISHATGAALARRFPEVGDKVRVVYHSVSPAVVPEEGGSASPFEADGIGNGYILSVSTLEPRKNLFRLIEAYGMLPGDLRRDHHLVVAGARGWKLTNLDEHIRRLNLGSFVHRIGDFPESAKYELYHRASVFALVSLYEGFGFPVLEAQAHSVPVLTSNVLSLPEIAGDGAVIVDPRDVSAIAQGLHRLLVDEALRQNLMAAASTNLQRFSRENNRQGLLDVFREAVASRRNTA